MCVYVEIQDVENINSRVSFVLIGLKHFNGIFAVATDYVLL
jgi:hypothetical protein